MSASDQPDPGVVLVTGGRRGIGRAIAERFAADGWAVALNDIDGRALENTVASISAGGGEISAHPADVSRRDQVDRLVEDVISSHGGLDVLVANAGVIRFAPLIEYQVDDFEETLRVNLIGAFHCTQAVARSWIEWGTPGAIVMVSSASALQARPGHAAYGSSKAGLEMFSRVAAIELAPYQIRVNCVAPGGPILTEFVAPLAAAPGWEERIQAVVPLGRTGTPEEVAEVVRFLAGSQAPYVTGAVVPVDGGVTLGRQ